MYFISRLKTMVKLLLSKEVRIWDKIPIVLLLVYIVSPIDLIPFPVLGFSFIDDIVVFLILMNLVNKSTIKYYTGKNNEIDPEHVVNDVDYEVKDDEKNEQ